MLSLVNAAVISCKSILRDNHAATEETDNQRPKLWKRRSGETSAACRFHIELKKDADCRTTRDKLRSATLNSELLTHNDLDILTA